MSKIAYHLAQMLLRMQTRCFAIRTVSWNTSTTREGQPYDNYTGENSFTAVPQMINSEGVEVWLVQFESGDAYKRDQTSNLVAKACYNQCSTTS